MKDKSITKFSKLKIRFSSNENAFFDIDISKWLINLSSKQISKKVTKLLSFGERFGLPFDRDDRHEKIASWKR